eukprot:GGOE01006579.1.p2 GENE.GGOE01006579.1~~GGOE01006579.1.p2  ORF type:complete len:312 (+),score=110.95 GGOE01006579.1:84-1019(+)
MQSSNPDRAPLTDLKAKQTTALDAKATPIAAAGTKTDVSAVVVEVAEETEHTDTANDEHSESVPHKRRCCAPKTWLTPEEWEKYSALALEWLKNPWHWPIIFVGLVVVLSGSTVALLILHIVPVNPESLRLQILEINFQILCGIFAAAAILMHPQRVMWWYHWHCKERPEKWKKVFPFHAQRPGETLFIIIMMNFNCLTSEGLGVLMWVTAATWQTRSQAAMGGLTVLSFGSGLLSGVMLGVRTAKYMQEQKRGQPVKGTVVPKAVDGACKAEPPAEEPRTELASELAIQVGLSIEPATTEPNKAKAAASV